MTNKFIEWVGNLGKPEFSKINKAIELQPQNFMTAADNSTPCPVVCNTRLVGSNAGDALNADSRYINYKVTGQTAQAQELLAQSPATVLAMILALTQQKTGFNPSDPAQAGNMNDYLRYVKELFQCPVLANEVNDQINCSYGSDWASTINIILGYYKGIQPADLNTLSDSLWAIARAASSCPNTSETMNLFVQNALNVEDGCKIYMYKTFVEMVEEKHKGSGKNAPVYTSDCTNFQLYRSVFHLDYKEMASYSAYLMGQTDANLHSWLNDNSAPMGTQAVNWTCNL
ncbi:hypothetical protein LY28_00251 [Ruminiclostridium sufflavum DSM 19573]|uniref:Uncharacterized protein n=1 Tax=Ruminiclostridium sufflavum DSM 19573 TaxID=1121337 RepID=A0A318Y459_9FIRM|nr:hypothetical protein [Ruminiclostridium sufflavum]PYG90368.1 hypothetical protein LY28_00251 [Ruminiclostridium sufflavum DSM 19573]